MRHKFINRVFITSGWDLSESSRCLMTDMTTETVDSDKVMSRNDSWGGQWSMTFLSFRSNMSVIWLWMVMSLRSMIYEMFHLCQLFMNSFHLHKLFIRTLYHISQWLRKNCLLVCTRVSEVNWWTAAHTLRWKSFEPKKGHFLATVR